MVQPSIRRRNSPPDKLGSYIFALFLIGRKMPQIIREEENLENEKHYKQFHYDNKPQRTTECHTAKALKIEVADVLKCIFHISRCTGFGNCR